jgi:hypothetical protein
VAIDDTAGFDDGSGRRPTMLVELEPAKPGFDRYWVTNGFDDFLKAARGWEETHVRCGDGFTTAHLSVDEHAAGPMACAACGSIAHVVANGWSWDRRTVADETAIPAHAVMTDGPCA